MKDTDFVEASAFLRVQEKRLITRAAFERIADVPDLMEARRMLSQDSDYDFSNQEAEEVLKAELQRVYALAYSLTEHRQVVDILACRYDYHNLKVDAKAKRFPQRTELPYIEVSTGRGDAQCAPAELSGRPQDIDITLDRAMFASMLSLAGEVGDGFISDYLSMLIDFKNILSVLRAKEMGKAAAFLPEVLIDGGKTPLPFFAENYPRTPAAMVPVFYYKYFGDAMRTGVEAYERTWNFSVLEKLLDNLLIDHTKKAKYIAFGPAVLFAYLLSKENELRQVRLVLTAKKNGLPPERLKERLRDTYV